MISFAACPVRPRECRGSSQSHLEIWRRDRALLALLSPSSRSDAVQNARSIALIRRLARRALEVELWWHINWPKRSGHRQRKSSSALTCALGEAFQRSPSPTTHCCHGRVLHHRFPHPRRRARDRGLRRPRRYRQQRRPQQLRYRMSSCNVVRHISHV